MRHRQVSAASAAHSLPRNTRRTRLPIVSDERFQKVRRSCRGTCIGVIGVSQPCDLLTNLLTLTTKTNEKQH